jgi:hypothetical protein
MGMKIWWKNADNETPKSGGKILPSVPLCQPQTPRGLFYDLTRACLMTGCVQCHRCEKLKFNLFPANQNRLTFWSDITVGEGGGWSSC